MDGSHLKHCVDVCQPRGKKITRISREAGGMERNNLTSSVTILPPPHQSLLWEPF